MLNKGGKCEIGVLETLSKYTPKLEVIKEIAKDEEKESKPPVNWWFELSLEGDITCQFPKRKY